MANTVDFVVVCVIDGKVHTAVPADFTEKQRAAILHIMYHIGEDPAPPVVMDAAQPIIDLAKTLDRDPQTVAALLEGGPAIFVGAPTLVGAPDLSLPKLGTLPDGTRVSVPAAKSQQDMNHEKAAKTQVARQSGYTGDACTQCGSMQVKRNGSCTVCESCGATTGCS